MAISWPCVALDLDRTIEQFDHRAWTARDGAPLDAWAMAQTTDGWLWFGSASGLHRFDGIRFEQVPLPSRRSRAIATLLATPSAELWIGFLRGGVSVLRKGTFTHYDESHGLFAGSVMDFERGVEGEIWAVGDPGVTRFDGERWQRIDEAWGLPRGAASNVKLDAHGTLWLSMDRGELMFLPRGAREFQNSGLQLAGPAEFQQTPDGRMWYTDKDGTRLLPGQEDIPVDTSWRNGTTSYVKMFDRDGALWGFGSLGVTRQPFPMTLPTPVTSQGADAFNETSGLSGLIIRTLMEDREGNIWVTTAAGVDRFRHSNVVRLPARERQRSPSAVLAEPGGRLWIAVRGTGVFGNYSDRLLSYENSPKPVAAPFGTVSVMYKHRDGSIWFGGWDGIWRRQGEHFLKVADPLAGARDEIFAMTADAQGNLWAAFVDRGLHRYRNGIWERNGNFAQLPDQTAYALATDEQDRVWVAYRDRVAVVDGDSAKLFGPDEGVNIGRPAALSTGQHLLLGGEYGLQLFVKDRFVTLSTQQAGESDRVTGVLETARGDLWWIDARGLVHVAVSDLHDAIANRSYRVKARLFGVDDGFPGTSRSNRPTPVITETPDGRIWFEGSAGIGFVDPRNVRTNPVAPVPRIRSVTVDGKTFDSHQHIVLQDVRDMQIDYTGLSLSLPEQLQFKYRLDGVDAQWHDAGVRRQALYSNLPPGEYVFRLNAANEAGVWGAEDAVLAVLVPPAFYETLWFRMSAGVLGLALLWLIHQWMLRQQAARLGAEHRARVHERERIARDLHDTLLQAMQGLILRLHSVSVRDISAETMRKDVAGLLDNAEALLEQGRDRVQQIASEHDTEDLKQAFIQTAERFVDQGATQFAIRVSGTPWRLRPDVHREALAIGREALVNACKHARASKIDVEIDYGASAITICVRDDGSGISDSVIAQGKHGHFGLQTMRRRANEIGAKLHIANAPTNGTQVTLHVPRHASLSGS